MTIRLRSTEGKCRHAAARAAEIAGADPAHETGRAAAPVVVTRARHQLRARIQRTQAAPAQTAEPARKQTHEPKRSTPADRKAEP